MVAGFLADWIATTNPDKASDEAEMPAKEVEGRKGAVAEVVKAVTEIDASDKDAPAFKEALEDPAVKREVAQMTVQGEEQPLTPQIIGGFFDGLKKNIKSIQGWEKKQREKVKEGGRQLAKKVQGGGGGGGGEDPDVLPGTVDEEDVPL